MTKTCLIHEYEECTLLRHKSRGDGQHCGRLIERGRYHVECGRRSHDSVHVEDTRCLCCEEDVSCHCYIEVVSGNDHETGPWSEKVCTEHGRRV